MLIDITSGAFYKMDTNKLRAVGKFIGSKQEASRILLDFNWSNNKEDTKHKNMLLAASPITIAQWVLEVRKWWGLSSLI